MNRIEPILTIDQVAVRFGGIQALRDVSFSVNRDSITAIIGPNGAGKTTVFNCITGFYKPTSGAIRFVTEKKAYQIEQLFGRWFGGSHTIAALGIARTFQNIRLFREMTVLENLLVAQHNHLNRNLISGLLGFPGFRKSEEKALATAYKWLDFVGLSAEANRPAGELPYGHQRRVEIARAMSTEAKLICLDEPAAGLNHKETGELAELIVKIQNDHRITVLVIEHDMNLVMKISDHIIVLDHGEVIALGRPTQIQKDPKVLSAYLGEEDPSNE